MKKSIIKNNKFLKMFIFLLVSIFIILAITKKYGQHEDRIIRKYVDGDSIEQTIIVNELILKLKNDNYSARKQAAYALGKIKDIRAIAPLIITLNDNHQSVRATATTSLSEIGSEAVKPLITALNDKNTNTRRNAAMALGMIADVNSTRPLIMALHDEDSDVRKNSAIALGKIGNIDAINALVSQLNNEDNAISDRNNAAQALTQIDDPNIVEVLINSLKDQNKYLRISTAKALGSIGNANAVVPLLNALKNSDAVEQFIIIEALVEIGDDRAIPDLVYLLRDWDNGSRAAKALQKLNWEPASISDSIHLLVVRRNGRELKTLWKDAKNVLLQDVTSNDYPVIQNAINAFIAIGKEEIIPELINILNSKGTTTIAEVFLNSGSNELSLAARAWAQRHGYTITHSEGSLPVKWGSW